MSVDLPFQERQHAFWIVMGMVSPSEIRLARVNLPALEKSAQTKAAAAQ